MNITCLQRAAGPTPLGKRKRSRVNYADSPKNRKGAKQDKAPKAPNSAASNQETSYVANDSDSDSDSDAEVI